MVLERGGQGRRGGSADGNAVVWRSAQAATKLNFYSFAKIHSDREREREALHKSERKRRQMRYIQMSRCVRRRGEGGASRGQRGFPLSAVILAAEIEAKLLSSDS